MKRVQMAMRHLTHDENVEIVLHGGEPVNFRVRAWQGQALTPLVVASQHSTNYTATGAKPSVASSRIANYVTETILRYSEYGFLYFEDEEVNNEWILSQCSFEFFGHMTRLRLYKPHKQLSNWDVIEDLIGIWTPRWPQ